MYAGNKKVQQLLLESKFTNKLKAKLFFVTVSLFFCKTKQRKHKKTLLPHQKCVILQENKK